MPCFTQVMSQENLGFGRNEVGRGSLAYSLICGRFSIPQTQQLYAHMDPSFVRCFGYRAPPLSAADAVEALSALLDVAGGVRMELEVEGARHGGEWFGGGRVWEGSKHANGEPRESREREGANKSGEGEAESPDDAEERTEVAWWVRNFWAAYDALTDVLPLRNALALSMSLHRAIIRQGTSIIDKQDIRTMRSHRVVVLSQGPDLALFAHPGVLSRLALWLIDALRDKLPGTKLARGKKSLPFVLACLNEKTETYIVVGVMGSLEMGDVTKNEFGLAFINAKERCNARSSHNSFNTSILEIDQEDLKVFLEALCEVGEGY